MNYNSIPEELQSLNQWICWQYQCRGCWTIYDSKRDDCDHCDGDVTKVPVDPSTGKNAKSNDPDTWGSFDTARDYHESSDDTQGVGFMFDPEGTIVGIDLDDVRDPETGKPTSEAKEIINTLDSWTEVSPSGTGFHVLAHGFVPDGGNRADIDDESHLEMYDSGRFFTVTGEHVSGTPETVKKCTESVREIHQEYVADEPKESNSGQSEPSEPTDVSLEDSELIEKAKSAGNGDKFDRLWRGSTSGYPSHSEARQALANLLAFWTGGDESRMLRLFRQSDLCRGDDDLRTFENYEIPTALDGRTDFYDPSTSTAPKAVGDGGVATAEPSSSTGPDGTGEVLSPSMLRSYAGLTGDDDKISDLNDRQKAAYTWELIKESEKAHVRVNRDNGELWAFDPETGTWGPDGERALRHAARKALGAVNYGGNVLEELKNQVRADPTAEVWNDVFGLKPGKVAVKNGLLDLEKAYNNESDALRDIEPGDYALTRLPVDYDPEADGSTWKPFVGDVVESNMIQTVQEYIGHCLHRENLYERALLLVGGGENGKSTFLNTIEAFLGDDSVTSVSPFDFGEKKSLARMHGGLANISVELEGGSLQGKNLANFKNLTGGDSVEARRLYQEPFDFTYKGGMLFATNEVPEVPVSDDDTAFWRRWIIVHFDNQFPEGSDKRDPTLGKRLKEDENLSAVLNWAIEGWGRLMENGEFDNVPPTPDETRRKWQSWGDSVDYFLSNVAEHDPDAPSISTNEAWEVYRAWCQENGHDFVGQSKFTNAAKDADLGYVSSVRTDRHSSPRRGYKAFGTIDEETDPVDVIEGNDDDRDDGHNAGLDGFDRDDDPDGDSEPITDTTDDSDDPDESDSDSDTERGGESDDESDPLEGEPLAAPIVHYVRENQKGCDGVDHDELVEHLIGRGAAEKTVDYWVDKLLGDDLSEPSEGVYRV